MNAFIRKEVRLLLPSFVLGLLLACSVWLRPGPGYGTTGIRAALVLLPFLVSPVVLILMTLSSFGRELSAGTFSQLLAQPVPRARVWWTKTLLLAGAVVLILAVWWISLSHYPEFLAVPRAEQRDTFLTTVLFVVAAYSGGLWTALLIRQFAAAFWLTLLAPAALATAIVGLFSRESDIVHPALRPALIIGFSLYGVGGFLFARWLFLRAQDTQWTGGTIALPRVRGLAGLFRRRGERRQWRPRAALWVKELQLHQSQFVLAAVLALLHLAVIATRKLGGGFKDSLALAFPLEQFWVLWLAMPLLVGCTAVAEERRLGTLESQLCLPSRRRTQFFIKFVSALLLSVVLGAAMPVLFEGNNILTGFQTESDTNVANYAIRTPQGALIPIGGILAFGRVLLPFLTLAGIAALIAILSLYASSLTRNTIQALSPAALGVLIAWSLFFPASAPNIYPLWRGGLIYVIGLPVMLLTFAGLMYWNFKRVLVGWAVWRRNAFALLAAVVGVMTATSATYHRVWEHFMIIEPAHGPAHLNQPVTMKSSYFHIAVHLPDGRNWSSRLDVSTPNWITMLTGNEKVTAAPGSAGYLEGTNWVDVARSYRDVIGIQNDGSLWVSVSELPKPEPLPAPPNPAMSRLGQDSDWKAVVAPGAQAFLLKTNGTLWRLGRSGGNWKDWPGFGAFAPVRVGADSNWARLSFREHGQVLCFEKTDGHVWILASNSQAAPDDEQIRADAELILTRAPHLEGQKSVARTWTAGPLGRSLQLGVGEDGVLRVVGYWGFTKTTNRLGRWRLIPASIQLGKETNWLALANEQDALVALKNDGTLWKLSFATDPITNPRGFQAKPLSRHSDWVGLTAMMDRIVSLAADGSLWYWAMEDPHRYARGFSFQPLLAPSRRPQFIGNIFASSGQ